MDVLIHISQQLSNSTTPAFEPTAFQVSSTAAALNLLFFLSLALVLIDAFLAMLVKGWLQEFDRGWRKYTVAHLRAQERERRLQELERWKLDWLVALLPILIQGSLLLFCIGLLVLIFPLHLPSCILCSLLFVSIVGFYGFTTYVSIVNNHAPFSSPVSRLLTRGLAMLQTWHKRIIRDAQRIASAISFHIRPTLLPQGQQEDADTSDETIQPSPSKRAQPHNPDSAEKSTMEPRSHSGIDPQMHVRVLERLVTRTDEAVENIPVFLELLDQPVKDPTLRPLNVEKWKELLHITLRLLTDQSTFPVPAACTLARTMMICYNRETPNEQVYLTLQQHLGSRGTDDRRPRMPLNVIYSSYLNYWFGYSFSGGTYRKIAFLEPSDAADAELLWMVNTFPRTIHRSVEKWHDTYLGFFAAVLTYVSSTEQCRRSNVPLTAAVIYVLHTIRSTLDRGGIDSVDGLYILPGDISTPESVLMTFGQVSDINALDLWSKECIQRVTDLFQWDWPSYLLNDFRLSLIAALYIDSTKRIHARSAFADLLKHTSIKYIQFEFSNAYDHGKLAVYSYMALTQEPPPQDHGPHYLLYIVIERTIYKHSTLQVSGLRILEMALKHVHKPTASLPDWLRIWRGGLKFSLPGVITRTITSHMDHWVLLHLDTLLSPHPYLHPEDVKQLEWSDTPEKVHIASARLDVYDSLAEAKHDGAKLPKPDPELLKVFLWSKDYEVCNRAFNWCLDLVPISQSGTPEDVNGTRMFNPETIGYEWVAHFIHVLCKARSQERVASLELLVSGLVRKWTMLPSCWRHDFAPALIFTVVQSIVMDGPPAYKWVDSDMSFERQQAFLPFLATLLGLIKPSLTWDRIISFENWLAQLPDILENQDAHTQMDSILATRKQQLQEENLWFFVELPMAGERLAETFELFAELPMADEWKEEILGFFAELPMASEWADE